MSYLTEAYQELAELMEQADSTDTQTRPMQFVKDLVGTIITPGMRVLDFGAGRHARNADYLRGKGIKCYAYDPYKATKGDGWEKGSVSAKLPGGLFDVVLSTYVLNTVKPDEAAIILRQAQKRGKCQIHVVRDDLPKDKAAKGYDTSRGFQRAVDLSSNGYTAKRKAGSYVAWMKGVKEDSLKESYQELARLTEMATASKDIAVQKKASAMFRKLQAFVRSPRKRPFWIRVEDPPMIGVAGANVDSRYKDLLFVFVQKSAQGSWAARFGPWKSVGGSPDIKYKITMKALPDDKAVADIKKIDLNRSWDDFVHEFTHYQDELRWKDPEGMFKTDAEGKPVHSYDAEKDPVGYYNAPEEFNAFFQGAMDRTRRILEAFAREGQTRRLRSILKTQQSFIRFVTDRFEGSLSRGFLQHLNQKYQRKLKLRLVKMHEELKERTMKLYEREWGHPLWPTKLLKRDEKRKQSKEYKLDRMRQRRKVKVIPKGGQIGLDL